AGFALALASYAILQLGGRFFSWKVFFRFTEIMLLFLAASLLIAGVDNLIGLGWIPALSGRLWNTSSLVPDTGMIGGLLVSLVGYRAEPDLIEVLTYAGYWGIMVWLLSRQSPKRI
ncbi:MAG TPA: FTR1 family iron permease, partial [Beijerinckiaceae bacterium]|nr:FTR1 family iron permease [Beijerinckiaceae bacterium]